MKASETYRLLATMAERNNEDFTSNIFGTLILHLACDLGLSREQCIANFTKFYDMLEPGFQAVRDSVKKLKPEDYGNPDKLQSISDAGLGVLLTHHSKDKSKS